MEFTPLEITEESLAFGAHEEVGHGGHFLGAEHTMERFRECFYRPLLSSTANFERWLKLGGKDTAARAGDIWRKKIEYFTPPPLDEGIRAELDDFVVAPPPRARRLASGGEDHRSGSMAISVFDLFKDGLAATTARGRNGGRKHRLTPDQVATARKLRADGYSIKDIGVMLGNGKPVSRQTVYRALGMLSDNKETEA